MPTSTCAYCPNCPRSNIFLHVSAHADLILRFCALEIAVFEVRPTPSPDSQSIFVSHQCSSQLLPFRVTRLYSSPLLNLTEAVDPRNGLALDFSPLLGPLPSSMELALVKKLVEGSVIPSRLVMVVSDSFDLFPVEFVSARVCDLRSTACGPCGHDSPL